MANEATAELYRRQSGLNKAKFKTDYDQYLEDLATKYGVSNDQLNANLESRGILRSGEAGTARTRLSAAEEAARTGAKSTFDYNIDTEDVDLMTKLAALQAGSGSSGGSGGSGGGGGTGDTTGGNTGDGSTTPPVFYRSPTDPAFDDMRNRGPRPSAPVEAVATPTPVVYGGGTTQGQLPQVALPTPAVRPVRDATPRPAVPATVVNMPRPGTTTPAATPSPVVYSGGTTQGALPQAPLPKAPDLSGVDWAGLGKMIEDNKKPKPAAVAKPATTRVNPVAARLR